MSDIVKRLRGAADAAARTLSDNSMMPPELSGLGDAEAEDLVFLCRDASDHIDALEAEVEIAERNRDAARSNFLTMQQAAAKLLEDANSYKGSMTANLERALAAEARATSLEQRLRDAGVE